MAVAHVALVVIGLMPAPRVAPPTTALARRHLALRLPAALLALRAAARPRRAAAADAAVLRDDAGFRYFDFRAGEGDTPRWGQLLTINYAGYTVQPDGSLRVFDSSFARGEPYFVKHGNGQTIKGLELAVHTMRVGGRRRVVLPQETLGFNLGALGPLPPKKAVRERLQDEISSIERAGRAVDLVYDVELLTVMDDVLDRGLYEDISVSTAQQEAGVTLEQVLRDAAARPGPPGPP
ncbi:hypothetical protein KFE25_010188 [Diacronema lutheri]|uniref:peptidylprolyl isomerase n=1 Tax=Diacronema lutheri TaxID=2081491 RepID=A0A8J5XKR7_DIALT|nr:hypothetical protein KFE25_010188 [Diacronema lutheri]